MTHARSIEHGFFYDPNTVNLFSQHLLHPICELAFTILSVHMCPTSVKKI